MDSIQFCILRNEKTTPDFNLAIEWLKENLGQEIVIKNETDEMISFDFYGVDMTYSFTPMPMNKESFIESDLLNPKLAGFINEHQSYTTLTCIPSNFDDHLVAINCYRIVSLVVIGISQSNDATSVFNSYSQLLMEKNLFMKLVVEKVRSKQLLPVSAWLKITVGSHETGNYGFTKGAKQFGLKELEIIDSQQSLQNIHSFLTDMASYSILNNVKFKDGETIGYTEDMKVAICKNKSTFGKGKAFRFFF